MQGRNTIIFGETLVLVNFSLVDRILSPDHQLTETATSASTPHVCLAWHLWLIFILRNFDRRLSEEITAKLQVSWGNLASRGPEADTSRGNAALGTMAPAASARLFYAFALRSGTIFFVSSSVKQAHVKRLTPNTANCPSVGDLAHHPINAGSLCVV